MPIFEKLKNIFASGVDITKKPQDYTYLKQSTDPSEVWDIVEEIGDGAFGKVYKVSEHCIVSFVCVRVFAYLHVCVVHIFNY